MYGTNTYTRLDIEFPNDAQQIAKQTDANLSNYNTQLSRTVLHDENRYSDIQIRPKQTGKYEYVHDNRASADETTTTSLPHDEQESYATNRVHLKPVKPESTEEPPVSMRARESSEYRPIIQRENSEQPPPKQESESHNPPLKTPPVVQSDDLQAIEIAKHRRLVHDTKSSIMAKKELYRKCKRRNRLLIFVVLIVLFILFAVVRRIMNNQK